MSFNSISFILDVLLGIILLIAGLFLLIAPYEKIQKVFPKVKSQKTCRILAAVAVLCGIGCIVIMLI